MTRTDQKRRRIRHQLEEKSPKELDALALQIPLRFSAAETKAERIGRLLPYVWRGWVEIESDRPKVAESAT